MTSVAESSDNYSATSRPDSTIIEPASVYHRVSYAYRYSRCRQEGGMSFKIAELFQSSCYRRRTGHATPARSDHTNIGTFCATLFTPGVVPCTIIAPGSDLDSWCTHRGGRLADDGAERRAPLHQLPSGVEPG